MEKLSSNLEPWHRLENKVVMVTGAFSGSGREFCLDLTAAGCKVIAAARRLHRLVSLCDQINASTSQLSAVAIELDISVDGEAIEARVQKGWDAFGQIDALVNNAGYRGNVNSPLDMGDEEWNTTVRTNLTGSLLVTKHVMALELGKYKIRVNAIAPGLFKSEITEDLMKKKGLNSVASRLVPLKKFGEINPALTSLLQYLIHDSSSHYVTGNVFITDSGVTLPGFPIFSSL
ncbi:Short-chain dehydrogenase/reductase SDR [Dillenia turbinata]|uniref:Short-chain dehydrogenase/reductase SDR n=1 Tax=Dillenia turbinata TaxID=194707 RepID=A0AAN8W905_9MAGN